MKKKKQKKSSLPSLFLCKKNLVIAALIILVLLGVSLNIGLQAIKRTPVTNKPQGLQYKIGMKKEETIHFEKNGQPWKTYKNYLYGYEISAPENWIIYAGGYTQKGKQQPGLSVNAPLRYDIPGSNVHGTYYTLSFSIDPQNSDNRKITVGEEAFIKTHESGDNALIYLPLDNQFIASTKEHQQAKEIIPTVKYLYSVEDAQSFIQSYLTLLPSIPPIRITPPKSEPFTNWKTYENKTLRFSFKYPSHWNLQDGGVGCGSDAIVPEGKSCVVIQILPGYWIDSRLEVYTSFDTLKTYYSQKKGASVKNFEMHGDQGIYIEYPQQPNEYTYHVEHLYIISHEGLMFVFRMGDLAACTGDTDPCTILDLRPALSDFDRMVKSISFQQ